MGRERRGISHSLPPRLSPVPPLLATHSQDAGCDMKPRRTRFSLDLHILPNLALRRRWSSSPSIFPPSAPRCTSSRQRTWGLGRFDVPESRPRLDEIGPAAPHPPDCGIDVWIQIIFANGLARRRERVPARVHHGSLKVDGVDSRINPPLPLCRARL